MIDLRTSETRMIGQLSRAGSEILYLILVREINYCSNPGALRTLKEHSFFNKRKHILIRMAKRKYCPMIENEDGRFVIVA